MFFSPRKTSSARPRTVRREQPGPRSAHPRTVRPEHPCHSSARPRTSCSKQLCANCEPWRTCHPNQPSAKHIRYSPPCSNPRICWITSRASKLQRRQRTSTSPMTPTGSRSSPRPHQLGRLRLRSWKSAGGPLRPRERRIRARPGPPPPRVARHLAPRTAVPATALQRWHS
jgi:hypothetical protein